MSKIRSFLNQQFGWLVVRLFFLEHATLSGFLKKWYGANGIMRYSIGQELEVRNPFIAGFGIRPSAKVVGYSKGGFFWETEDGYILDVTSDSKGDYNEWCDTGKVPTDAERVTRYGEKHFKWNVEYLFKPAKKGCAAQPPNIRPDRIFGWKRVSV
jgi:hypothetical protein